MRVRVWTRGYPSDHVATIVVADDAEDDDIARQVRAKFGSSAAVAEVFRSQPAVEPVDEEYARMMSFRDNS